jgi:hypothetical protein
MLPTLNGFRSNSAQRWKWTMKREKNKTPRRKSRRNAVRHPIPQKTARFKKPKIARQYYAMPPREQEIWDSLAHVISRVRDGQSLRKASKEFGIAASTVVELGRPALRKKNGRLVATKKDRLLRVVTILKAKGRKVIATRDSVQASLIGSHWAAVQRYLQTGDDSALLKFKKTRVADASGKRHALLTNLAELNRQASAGVLSFESMYAGGSR